MALTLAQMMQVAAPAVIQEMGKPYMLAPIQQMENIHGYRTFMYSRNSDAYVSIVWSHADELRIDTERKRIEFVKALLENAVNSLTDFIQDREAEYKEEVWDVTYE